MADPPRGGRQQESHPQGETVPLPRDAAVMPTGTPAAATLAGSTGRPAAGAPRAAPGETDQARSPQGDAWATLLPLAWPHGAALRRRLAGGPPGHPGLAATHPYDVLRTRALHVMADAHWSRLGVTQSSPGPASATTALNLALAAARRPDQRVALVDLDLERQPVLGLLGQTLTAPNGPTRSCRSRVQPNLALISFAAAAGRGSETLLAEQFHRHVADLLAELAPDLVVVHVPPILAGDAGIAAVEMVDTVLIAVDGTQDTATSVRGAERLVAARRPVLGLFLYDAEG
ncbi:hypothetical protein [Paracoccus endophyticus]|uniref:hypothetical protein n=1 Tax=Paracoccus endophyticus TaxID=2233774 RepID=UPI000DD7B3BC|nr:hypothetical protein [Paracoccus endophyticus]